MARSPRRCIVPPYLARRIAEHTPHAVALDERLRSERVRRAGPARAAPDATLVPATPNRRVFTAANTEDLPGALVRGEGEPATGDPAVDEAYEGFGATFALYAEVYGRNSIDGAGRPLEGTVHFGVDYDNAFWNGEQMVFGDGDGRYFTRFTVAVDVVGHELTHGVTDLMVGLNYRDQSGALSESLSDVFGSLVKQRLLGQDVAAADWLIGAGLFTAAVDGLALRSMRDPGTAYDDPVLGRDPQPGSMTDYVRTEEDNGGVHINSGIPNRAFYLAATAIGGQAWAGAGRIWYAALTDQEMRSDADFAAFAQLTLRAAKAIGGNEHDAVAGAWATVGLPV